MSQFFCGIDPGLDGAIAFISECGKVLDVLDTPTLLVTGGKKNKRHYDINGMVKIFASMAMCTYRAALEDVHPMPQEGVVSAFSFGQGLGIWKGILAALLVPTTMVTPQKWKKLMMDGQGKEKDASRLVAAGMFRDAYQRLTRKKDHGRADALLIAEYLRRTWSAHVEADVRGY